MYSEKMIVDGTKDPLWFYKRLLEVWPARGDYCPIEKGSAIEPRSLSRGRYRYEPSSNFAINGRVEGFDRELRSSIPVVLSTSGVQGKVGVLGHL